MPDLVTAGKVVFITLIPGIELRGSIPYAILEEGMTPLTAFALATAANILIIPPAFLFLTWFFRFIEKLPPARYFIARTRRKAKPYVNKYGAVGLALFVGVPLPGTGAYTGALAAYLFDMKKRKAFPSIAAGVILAGLAVTLIATIFSETLGWLL